MKGDVGPAETRHVGIRGWSGRVRGRGQQGHAGMEPVVCIERVERSGRVLGVVVGELGHGQEAGPVGLLVVAVHPQVL